MNVRELCHLLSATLHLPGVERWAEQLVRRELLPGVDHGINALDAALLLAAVVAAPNPEDAPRVVVTLADLPLTFLESRIGTVKSPIWARGTDDDIAAMPRDPLEILTAAIEEPLDPEAPFIFSSLRIEESGLSAEFRGCIGADFKEYRAIYALPGAGLPSGLTRSVEIHRDVTQGVGKSLLPPAEHVADHHESTFTSH